MRRALTLPAQVFSGVFVRSKLKNKLVLDRFSQLHNEYDHVFSQFNGVASLDRSSDGYSWDSWSGKIRQAFQNGVRIDFLAHPLICFTMVYYGRDWNVQSTKNRSSICKDTFGEDEARRLLIEDYIGLPVISDLQFLTSSNRAHHGCHLAYFYKLSGNKIWSANTIVEWGGGYGNMARIIRRMNPNITYIIVDLPELLALQYVYLGSLEGADKINVVASDKDLILANKVNLVSSELLLADRFEIKCDAFISTWALTECPEYIQKYVTDKFYFSAKDVYIASRIDENNHLARFTTSNISKSAVPDLNGNHEYWAIKSSAEKN
jgi:hypothetical protein